MVASFTVVIRTYGASVVTMQFSSVVPGMEVVYNVLVYMLNFCKV